MPTDILTLGPFTFDSWSTPEKLPGGGRQQLVVHRTPGGGRTIDAMGPDDIDRAWSGLFRSDDAAADALTLDALRRSGTPLPYTNGMEARTVVIMEFLWSVRKVQCIEYSIIVTPTDSFGGGGGFGGGIGGLLGGLGGFGGLAGFSGIAAATGLSNIGGAALYGLDQVLGVDLNAAVDIVGSAAVDAALGAVETAALDALGL